MVLTNTKMNHSGSNNCRNVSIDIGLTKVISEWLLAKMWSLNPELEKEIHNIGELRYQRKEMYLRMFPRTFIAGSTGVILFHPLILPQSPFLFYLQLHVQFSIIMQYQSIRNVLLAAWVRTIYHFPPWHLHV